MYAEIIVDCQSKTDQPNCEYCIANRTCQLRKSFEKNNKIKTLITTEVAIMKLDIS